MKDAVFRVTLPPREKGSTLSEHQCCTCAEHDAVGVCCTDSHPLDREQAAAIATTRELGS